MKIGSFSILLTMVMLPALGYALKKTSDNDHEIVKNKVNLFHYSEDVKEMKSDIKDMLKASNIKSTYRKGR